MNYPRILQETNKVHAVIVAFIFSSQIGGIAYAQNSAPQISKESMCSLVPTLCLIKPYVSKKWRACAYEAAEKIQGCYGSLTSSKEHTCTTMSMKITELAVEGTKYGPLFTLLVSGTDGGGGVFRYTANCHVSKTGELIEFKAVVLR